MASEPLHITAAIARRGEPFALSECELLPPASGEVQLRMEAVGVCHTDLAVRDHDLGLRFPAVLGHEGVGIVEALGPDVRGVSPGDRVLVSFSSCGHCARCNQGAPAYCHNAHHAFRGLRADGSSPILLDGEVVSGHFFGQSSFATHAVVSTVNMVKLGADLSPELMAPMACGVQTGMAAVVNVLAASASDSLAVYGCGTVGLSAIMAAKICGCRKIVAVDLQKSRLALAVELGATDVVLAGQPAPEKDPLRGTTKAFDTTGNPDVIAQAFNALGAQGVLVCAGISKPGSKASLDLGGLLFGGKTLRGTLEGDAVPQHFIPRMIEWYRQGLLPLEKIVRVYDFAEINQAVDDLAQGRAVKPVLLFPSSERYS
jgi:aryl-alcohol dehydrogenase